MSQIAARLGLVLACSLSSFAEARSFPHHIVIEASLRPENRDTGGGVQRERDLLVRLVTEDASFVYYQELHCDVPIVGRDEHFAVRLGTVDPALNPLDLDFSESYWLSVVACPDDAACASMEPRFCDGVEVLRQPISAVGYAFRALYADEADHARYADDCDLLDGHDSSDFMPAGTDLWVDETGDSMTGRLTLSDDPADPMHAATKQYVDRPRPDLTVPPGYSILGSTTTAPAGFTYRGQQVQDPSAWRRLADLIGDGENDHVVACAGTLWLLEGSRLWKWDQATDTWNSFFPRLSMNLLDYGLTVALDRIYVIGGKQVGTGVISSRVLEYDPIANRWTPRAQLPRARYKSIVAAVGGSIHVLGGYDGVNEIHDHLKYDVASDTWGAAAPAGWFPTGIAEVQGKLYVMGSAGGGLFHEQANFRLEVYDPATDAWEWLGVIPQAFIYPTCATTDEAFYCMAWNDLDGWGAWGGGGGGGGGTDWGGATQDWLRFEPASGHWQRVPGPVTLRYGASVATLGGEIHVVGGRKIYNVEAPEHEVLTPPGLLFLHRKD